MAGEKISIEIKNILAQTIGGGAMKPAADWQYLIAKAKLGKITNAVAMYDREKYKIFKVESGEILFEYEAPDEFRKADECGNKQSHSASL